MVWRQNCFVAFFAMLQRVSRSYKGHKCQKSLIPIMKLNETCFKYIVESQDNYLVNFFLLQMRGVFFTFNFVEKFAYFDHWYYISVEISDIWVSLIVLMTGMSMVWYEYQGHICVPCQQYVPTNKNMCHV